MGEVKNEPQAFYRILFVAGGSVGFGCNAMAGVKSFGTGDQRRRTTGTTEQKMSLLRRRVGGRLIGSAIKWNDCWDPLLMFYGWFMHFSSVICGTSRRRARGPVVCCVSVVACDPWCAEV